MFSDLAGVPNKKAEPMGSARGLQMDPAPIRTAPSPTAGAAAAPGGMPGFAAPGWAAAPQGGMPGFGMPGQQAMPGFGMPGQQAMPGMGMPGPQGMPSMGFMGAPAPGSTASAPQHSGGKDPFADLLG